MCCVYGFIAPVMMLALSHSAAVCSAVSCLCTFLFIFISEPSSAPAAFAFNICLLLSVALFVPFEKSWLSKQSVSVSYPLFFLNCLHFLECKNRAVFFFVDCVILENGEILHIKFSWSPSSEVFFICKHDINNVIKQKNKFLTAELLNSLAAH